MLRAGITSSLLATALAAALAGCGGGSGRGASSAYASAAESICRQERVRLEAMPQPRTPAQAIGYLPHAIGIIGDEAGRLSALRPPPQQSGAVHDALTAAQRLNGVLSRFLARLRAGSVELSTFAQVQTQGTALRDEIDASFRRAGLAACART
jgi:hypothetical protein